MFIFPLSNIEEVTILIHPVLNWGPKHTHETVHEMNEEWLQTGYIMPTDCIWALPVIAGDEDTLGWPTVLLVPDVSSSLLLLLSGWFVVVGNSFDDVVNRSSTVVSVSNTNWKQVSKFTFYKSNIIVALYLFNSMLFFRHNKTHIYQPKQQLC